MDVDSKPSSGAYILYNAQVIPIQNPITTLGRLLENDVVINDPGVSRYHAEIHREGNQFVLLDKESTGGTFVNNKRVTRAVLYSGDLISLAGLPMMFVIDSAKLARQTEDPTGNLGDS